MRVGSQHWQIVPQILSSKYPTQNRAGEVIQVVVLLPNKPEAMNSNLSTIKKKKIHLYYFGNFSGVVVHAWNPSI
jgi:hypothetical protein